MFANPGSTTAAIAATKASTTNNSSKVNPRTRSALRQVADIGIQPFTTRLPIRPQTEQSERLLGT